jgi:glycosyltransferase involved in cell wall biosynthesis
MRIAFLLPRGYDLLSGRGGIHGGAELQVARLAGLLAARGHEVAVLTARHQGAVPLDADGVQLLPVYDERAGLPFLRTFAQARALSRALDEWRPDVVVQRGASPFTGLLARDATRRGHAFVFMLSNDSNVDGRYEAAANWRDRLLYRDGLRRASLVIVQTETQAALLRERYGIAGFHLPSAVPAVPDTLPLIAPRYVFWAGRFERHKRPHLVLDLARRARDLEFVVAGWVAGAVEYGRGFEAEAGGEPNVRLVGHRTHREMDTHYHEAIALLSTSEYEGFSNTFLEAWRLGLPVVSMGSDPDGTIERFGLGVHDADPDAVVDALRRFRDDAGRRAAVARAARAYMERHDETTVAVRLETRLLDLVRGGARHGGSR